MKYNSKTTLYTYIGHHIGQVSIGNADKEVERMRKQTGDDWHKDFRPFMEVIDETDYETVNPCPLNEGYCWITKDF